MHFRLFQQIGLGIAGTGLAVDAGRMETPFDYYFDYHTNPRTIEALKSGPLASALEAYAQRLHEDGYATHSGFVQLRLLGCFNRWLDRKGLTSFGTHQK